MTIRTWSRAGRRTIGAHGGVISPADGAGYHGVRADRHGPNLSAPTFLELVADFRLRSGRQGHRVPDGIPQMSSQLTHRWREVDSNLRFPNKSARFSGQLARLVSPWRFDGLP